MARVDGGCRYTTRVLSSASQGMICAESGATDVGLQDKGAMNFCVTAFVPDVRNAAVQYNKRISVMVSLRIFTMVVYFGRFLIGDFPK